MKTLNTQSVVPQAAVKAGPTLTDQTVKSLAHTIFCQLQTEGCQAKDIISVSSQLLSLVTTELRKSSGSH